MPHGLPATPAPSRYTPAWRRRAPRPRGAGRNDQREKRVARGAGALCRPSAPRHPVSSSVAPGPHPPRTRRPPVAGSRHGCDRRDRCYRAQRFERRSLEHVLPDGRGLSPWYTRVRESVSAQAPAAAHSSHTACRPAPQCHRVGMRSCHTAGRRGAPPRSCADGRHCYAHCYTRWLLIPAALWSVGQCL